MTNLERFRTICAFEKPDRALRWYTFGFWKDVAPYWHEKYGIPADTDLLAYYDLEYPGLNTLPGNAGGSEVPFTPYFEEKIIKDEGDVVLVQRANGKISRDLKEGTTMPQWISFPVTNREEWKQVRERIRFENHDLGAGYNEEIKHFQSNDEPNMLFVCGIYAFGRALMGDEHLAYAYYDEPDMVREFSEWWLSFYSQLLEKLIRDMRIDFVLFHEDMAFKNGPLIGPDLFTRYMTPYYREMITHLKKLGQTVIGVDSDGNVDVLLKLFHDIGMNMMNPFEQAAGNDILAIRAKYPNLLMWGGIDKRILLDGRDAIDREIDEKVAPMWEQGGFFPSIDHSTPPCPMENFNYFLKRLQAVCE